MRRSYITRRHGRRLALSRRRGHADARGQDAVPAIRFLINRDVVRESSKEVEFRLDPAQTLFGRDEDAEVAHADCCCSYVNEPESAGEAGKEGWVVKGLAP